MLLYFRKDTCSSQFQGAFILSLCNANIFLEINSFWFMLWLGYLIIISRLGLEESTVIFTYSPCSQKDTVTGNVLYLSICPGLHHTPCRFLPATPYLTPTLRVQGVGIPASRGRCCLQTHISVMESRLNRPGTQLTLSKASCFREVKEN